MRMQLSLWTDPYGCRTNTFGDMLACMSDASMLGCETTIQFSEYLDVKAEFSEDRWLVLEINTGLSQITDWSNLSGIGVRVEQDIEDLPPSCFLETQDVVVTIDNTRQVSTSATGQANSEGVYICLVPYDILSKQMIVVDNDLSSSMREVCVLEHTIIKPKILKVKIGTFKDACFGSIKNFEGYATSLQPYNYHASGSCMSWKTCQQCLNASCNWCEWNSDSNREPLPPWIPDYDIVQQAFVEGGGSCGIHPFICRETTGTFNACRDSVKKPRDMVWSFALFVIPVVFIYCVFQLKKNRSVVVS